MLAASPANPNPRLSAFSESLTDDGPVPAHPPTKRSAASRQPSTLSMQSSISSEDGLPPPPFLTAFGDLRPNRDSMVSLQEAEYGWAGSASAVTAATKARRVQDNRFNTKPVVKAPYRPPFAPSVSDTDLEAVVPTVPSDVPTQAAQVSRGKSLREKIQGAIRRDKSPEPSPKHTTGPLPPLEPTQEEDDLDDDKKVAASAEFIVGGQPPLAADRSSPQREGFAEGIVRRLSRRTTRKPRASLDPGYTLPSQAEIDNIPLYAAPPEANVKNAPMLSSYAPRPALRPRAMTEGQGANLKAQPSITVGAARLAYAKSISRQQRTGHPAVPTAGTDKVFAKDDIAALPNKNRSRNTSHSSNASSVTEEHLSIAPRTTSKPRRSRQVPEGWQAASAFEKTPEATEAAKQA